MTTYSEKLKHPKWQMRRLEILKRDNATCQLCGDTETELHIHHLKYTREPWDAPDCDLQSLCKPCHNATEMAKGEFKLLKAKKVGRNLVCKIDNESIHLFVINEDNSVVSIVGFKKNSSVLESIYKMMHNG